jgi:serine/threonine-protein kinase HipA
MAARRKNAHYRVAEIRRGHWEAMASNHLGESAEPIIAELLTDTPMVIERVGGALRNDFPAEVSDRIFDGLLKSAKRLGA